MPDKQNIIGKLVGGGIGHNLRATLDIDSEIIELGSYVVIHGLRRMYYALVTDLSYAVGDPRYSDRPIDNRVPPNLAARVNSKALKTVAELMPHLAMDLEPSVDNQMLPATTLPPVHSRVGLATASDVARIFGQPDQPGYWVLGYTREQGHPIAIDLRRAVQRSTGIFGSTGAGKSQLNKVILSGLISQDIASTIVFDMHNDYCYDDVSGDTGATIPGLKTLFPKQVISYGLGSATKVRGKSPDQVLEISLYDLEPGDILLLDSELNLTDASSTITAMLYKNFGKSWLKEFLSMIRVDDDKSAATNTVSAWAKKAGVSQISANALWSKLMRIKRLSYIVEQPSNSIQQVIHHLQHGRSVILSFGENASDLDYLLATNVISRLISRVWQSQADTFRSTQQAEPRRLVMVLEEAHKLVSKSKADQTTIGGLSREMRKSYLTIILVDQKPGQIDNEVMSQLGTRISGWLGDETDINALLVGLSGKDGLKRMINSLRPCGQMLIAGWGVPSPIAIQSRWLDENLLN